MKTMRSQILVTVFVGCLGLSQATQAVSPPPDGGYAGGNTAEGQNALLNLSSGGFNTAVGFLSLRSDSIGSFNTAIGAGALLANIAFENTATGTGALLSDTIGSGNTANGAFALVRNITGFNNTALGAGAGFNVTTANNVICIGNPGQNVGNSCYIGNIFGVTSSGGTAVFINSDGQLGTSTSSRRFKEEIKAMEQASEALYSLKPVAFRYKKQIDPAGTSQLGLVAEDVDKVNPDLVVRDKEGKPYSVRYDQVNAMLLNEFLKEHRTVLELKKEIAALTAVVKEQGAQIQKVSAEIELNKPAPQQVVLKNP
jgi:Chaperone of endosialidase